MSSRKTLEKKHSENPTGKPTIGEKESFPPKTDPPPKSEKKPKGESDADPDQEESVDFQNVEVATSKVGKLVINEPVLAVTQTSTKFTTAISKYLEAFYYLMNVGTFQAYLSLCFLQFLTTQLVAEDQELWRASVMDFENVANCELLQQGQEVMRVLTSCTYFPQLNISIKGYKNWYVVYGVGVENLHSIYFDEVKNLPVFKRSLLAKKIALLEQKTVEIVSVAKSNIGFRPENSVLSKTFCESEEFDFTKPDFAVRQFNQVPEKMIQLNGWDPKADKGVFDYFVPCIPCFQSYQRQFKPKAQFEKKDGKNDKGQTGQEKSSSGFGKKFKKTFTSTSVCPDCASVLKKAHQIIMEDFVEHFMTFYKQSVLFFGATLDIKLIPQIEKYATRLKGLLEVNPQMILFRVDHSKNTYFSWKIYLKGFGSGFFQRDVICLYAQVACQQGSMTKKMKGLNEYSSKLFSTLEGQQELIYERLMPVAPYQSQIVFLPCVQAALGRFGELYVNALISSGLVYVKKREGQEKSKKTALKLF